MKIRTKQIDSKDGTIEVYLSADLNIAIGTNPTAWTDIPFNVEDFKGSIYTHSVASNQETIVFNSSGYYEIEYSVSTNNTSSSSRSSCEIEVQIDTGGGFNTVPRTSSYSYNRSFTVGLDTRTKRFGLQVTAGTSIKVRVRKIAGSNGTQLAIVADGTSLLIRRIE